MQMQQGSAPVCLFPLCELVNEFNSEVVKRLNLDVVEIPAIMPEAEHGPGKKGKQNNKGQGKKMGKKRSRETAGLEQVLKLAVGCRVMLRRNLNQSLGLINGAIGVVTGIRTIHDNMVSRIIVDFPGHKNVSIDRVKGDFEISTDVFIKMSQFPLSMAYALTWGVFDET